MYSYESIIVGLKGSISLHKNRVAYVAERIESMPVQVSADT